MSTTLPLTPTRQDLVRELVDLFTARSIEVKAAGGIAGYAAPQPIANDGYGSSGPKRPDVVGFDSEFRRIVFGLVRVDRQSLDSEASLEEYNVFLDHNAGLKDRATVVYVLMPQDLVNEFTGIITHYIHPEYWDRIIAAGSRKG